MSSRRTPRIKLFSHPQKPLMMLLLFFKQTFNSFFQSNDENLDVSLSVPQYNNNGQQQQQSVNQTYHEMNDQVNIWRELRKVFQWNRMEIVLRSLN